MYNRKAYEKICRLKGLKPEKANFSLVCYDLSHVSDFTKNIKNATYKLMHRLLPGPYTFILRSSKQVSRQLGFKKPEIGLRVPNHAIPRSIVKKLGNPIFSASIKHSDEVLEYMTDPEEIHEAYANEVDIVIDGGPGGNIATTIIDYTGDEPWMVRAGMGEVD
jgi:tRNA threonylcarbamoyl adenosine modification protein (Sua5/YciO/YrdC/YwlC family)